MHMVPNWARDAGRMQCMPSPVSNICKRIYTVTFQDLFALRTNTAGMEHSSNNLPRH